MSDENPPQVPIVCPECETTTRVPLSEVAELLDRHNDQLHDGDEVATVDPDVADSLADIVAAELGLTGDAEG